MQLISASARATPYPPPCKRCISRNTGRRASKPLQPASEIAVNPENMTDASLMGAGSAVRCLIIWCIYSLLVPPRLSRQLVCRIIPWPDQSNISPECQLLCQTCRVSRVPLCPTSGPEGARSGRVGHRKCLGKYYSFAKGYHTRESTCISNLINSKPWLEGTTPQWEVIPGVYFLSPAVNNCQKLSGFLSLWEGAGGPPNFLEYLTLVTTDPRL